MRAAIHEWEESWYGSRATFNAHAGDAYNGAIAALMFTMQDRPEIPPIVFLAAVHDHAADKGRIGPADEVCPHYADFVESLRRQPWGDISVVFALESTLEQVSRQYPVGDPTSAVPTASKPKAPAKKRHTQPQVDAKLESMMEGKPYRDLRDAVRRGDTSAQESARKTYGPRPLADALGIKAHAMVSKSPVYKRIRSDMGLPPKGTGRRARVNRGGNEDAFTLALADKSEAAGDTTSADVCRRETLQLIEESTLGKAKPAIVEQLTMGKMTDEQAREVVAMGVEERKLITI
jgi:hypothetical protein